MPKAKTGGNDGGDTALLRRIAAALERLAPPAVATKAPAAGVTRVPHDTMRKRIAEHLTHSVTVAPHVTAFLSSFDKRVQHFDLAFADSPFDLTF